MSGVPKTHRGHGTPPAEHPIDQALVRALLRQQHPDLADASLRKMDSGWDNVMFRLGDDFVVRLPRRRQAVDLVRHEQAWLPRLAQRLPLPIPAPRRVGRPGCGYPWPWSVLPWMPGTTADLSPPHASQGTVWAEFLRALHQPDGLDAAPKNPARGVPLADRAHLIEARLHRLEEATEYVTSTLWEIWRQALEAPVAETACWLHGDLHQRNVLVDEGRLSGVIDWGDVTSGDPATDLASLWALFEGAETRREAWKRYGASPDLVTRAKGWSVHFGSVLLESGLVDHPAHAEMGRCILQRLMAEA